MSAQLEKFQRFLASDPDNVKLATATIDEAFRAEQYEVAKQVLDARLPLVATNPGLMLRASMLDYFQDGSEQAILKLEEVSGLNPEDEVVRDYYLAEAHYKNKNYPSSVERLLRHAFVSLPSRDILNLLAEAAKEQGDLYLAIRAHEFGNEKLGVQTSSYSELGLLHLELNNMEDAESAAAQALSFDDQDPQAKFVMGSCAIAKGQIDVATPLLNDAATAFPDSGRPVAALGMAALSQHDYAAGAAKLSNAIALTPDHLGMRVALAWSYLLQFDAPAAIAAMQEANKVDANFAECHGTLAVAYLFNEQEDEARESIKIANRLNRNNFSGRFAQALIIAKTDATRYEKIVNAILDQPVGPEDKPLREMIFATTVTRH